MKRSKLSILFLMLCVASFAQAPVPGGQSKRTPIDTNEIILVVVAVLLTVGVVA